MHQYPTKSQVDGETQYVAGKTEEVDAPPQARKGSPLKGSRVQDFGGMLNGRLEGLEVRVWDMGLTA